MYLYIYCIYIQYIYIYKDITNKNNKNTKYVHDTLFFAFFYAVLFKIYKIKN